MHMYDSFTSFLLTFKMAEYIVLLQSHRSVLKTDVCGATMNLIMNADLEDRPIAD
jgi:hypothetical protein